MDWKTVGISWLSKLSQELWQPSATQSSSGTPSTWGLPRASADLQQACARPCTPSCYASSFSMWQSRGSIQKAKATSGMALPLASSSLREHMVLVLSLEVASIQLLPLASTHPAWAWVSDGALLTLSSSLSARGWQQ